MQEIYLAGGCLWGVQEYFRYVPGVLETTAGRANGTNPTTNGDYDGYAECVRLRYDPAIQSVYGLMQALFKIIELAREFIQSREDSDRIAVEVCVLTLFVPSDPEHQDRLLRCPDDYCHMSQELLYSYRK